MLQVWMVKNCVNYDNKMVIITIMIIIKPKKEVVVFRNKKKSIYVNISISILAALILCMSVFFLLFFLFSSITFIVTVDELCS